MRIKMNSPIFLMIIALIEKKVKNDLKLDMKNNNSYINDRENENENLINKKQHSIYYRAVRAKEKKKIEFTK